MCSFFSSTVPIIPSYLILSSLSWRNKFVCKKNDSEKQEEKIRRKAFSSATFSSTSTFTYYHITIVSNTMPSSFRFKKGFLNKKSSPSSSSSTTTTTNPPPSTFQTARTIPNENDAATEVASEASPSPPFVNGVSKINQSIHHYCIIRGCAY